MITFTGEDGTDYRLELWKRDYMFGGGSGGEIGIYTRNNPGGFQGLLQHLLPGYYSTAQGEDQMRMSQTIYNTETGEIYFTNDNQGSADGDHYWNFAVQSDANVPREQLGQTSRLYPNANQYDAMVSALEAEGFDVTKHADGSISFQWE